MGDGKNTRFWKDTWLGHESLANKYPRLFHISNQQDGVVARWGGGAWLMAPWYGVCRWKCTST